MKTSLLIALALCFGAANFAAVPINYDEELYESGNSGGRSIQEFVAMVRHLGMPGLIERFDGLRLYDPDQTYWVQFQAENYPLNRYPMPVYDESRVILSQEFNPGATTDFVSANFVDGFKHKREYIMASCKTISCNF